MHVAADTFTEVAPQAVTDTIIKVLEGIFADIMGEVVLSMHPMSMDSAGEDDMLLAAWHKAGCYVLILRHGCYADIDLPKHEQHREVAFYTRTMQKNIPSWYTKL